MKKGVSAAGNVLIILLLAVFLAAPIFIPPVAAALALENPDAELNYGAMDPVGDMSLQTNLLDHVVDEDTVLIAVRRQINTLTENQMKNPANMDLIALFAETAISNAAITSVQGNEIIINRSTVSGPAGSADKMLSKITSTLEQGEIDIHRKLESTVTFLTDAESEISIRIEPDILRAGIDRVCVRAPSFSIGIHISDFSRDLKQNLTILAEDLGADSIGTEAVGISAVQIQFSKNELFTPVILSVPVDGANVRDMAFLDGEGKVASSKYNPVSQCLEGRVNKPGLYTPTYNRTNFDDILQKDPFMQHAILEMAARGIINGTSETSFSPDRYLTRAHFVALVMRGLGKVTSSDAPSFGDVSSNAWYYKELGSSQRLNFIQGYPDGDFHGDWPLTTTQVYGIAGRILKSEMGYKEPSADTVDEILSRYADVESIGKSLRSVVALSDQCGLIIPRWDKLFHGGSNMTRGNAAIVLYCLFQRIW